MRPGAAAAAVSRIPTALAIAGWLAMPLAACAAFPELNESDPELRTLSARARGGDKQAQLALGVRFEEGRGVPVDRKRAARLYRAAAADSGGSHTAYVPQGDGSVAAVALDGGTFVPGLVTAQERLARLDARSPAACAESRSQRGRWFGELGAGFSGAAMLLLDRPIRSVGELEARTYDVTLTEDGIRTFNRNVDARAQPAAADRGAYRYASIVAASAPFVDPRLYFKLGPGSRYAKVLVDGVRHDGCGTRTIRIGSVQYF